MRLAVICFSSWPGLPDGSMSPLPTFGPDWFRIPASNPLSRHMPPPLLPQPVPTIGWPVPPAPCILTPMARMAQMAPMAPMATMAWSPLRTSLASQAPLPPATPMMARRVVTVSPVKVSAPTFVSGAVPAPPVYGIPVITRTVRYAGWDWETKNGFGKRLDLDQMRTGELLLLSVCPKLTRLQNGYGYSL